MAQDRASGDRNSSRQQRAHDPGMKYRKYGRHPIGRLLISRYFQDVSALARSIPKDDALTLALEVGCGAGYSTQRLTAGLPHRITLEASDPDSFAVEEAVSRNPGLRVVVESAYDLRRETGSLDLVILLEVLEHLGEPVTALREIRRSVRPGGYLIVGVPNEPMWRILNVARGAHLGALGNTPGHINHWSGSQLRTLIQREFGEILEVRSPIPWTIALARRR